MMWGGGGGGSGCRGGEVRCGMWTRGMFKGELLLTLLHIGREGRFRCLKGASVGFVEVFCLLRS